MNYIDLITSNNSYFAQNDDSTSKYQQKAKRLCFEYNNTPPDNMQRRREILNDLLGTSNDLVFIEPSFRCDFGFNIHAHGFLLMNYNCVILDTSPVNIGEGVFIAPGVVLACAGHAIDPEQRASGIGSSAPITIEDEVWIGANATVIGGVTIGKGSIIGAGSVVTRDIPGGVIAYGNPCKVRRKITDKDKISPENIFRIIADENDNSVSE